MTGDANISGIQQPSENLVVDRQHEELAEVGCGDVGRLKTLFGKVRPRSLIVIAAC